MAAQQLNAQVPDPGRDSNILFATCTNSIAFFPARDGRVSDSCVVIFSAWSGRALCGKIGGTDPLLRAGIDVISIQSNCDDWHQSIPPEAYDDLALYLNERYQHKYGYGSSMGGYGALLFAHRLNLDVVLAMSPQYTIQDDFDKRWSAFADRIQWQYDIADSARDFRGKVFVTFDPYCLDAQHFRWVKDSFRLAQVTGIPARFGGHPTAAYFHESQCLKDMAIDVLTKGEVPDFSANNKSNKIYLLALSVHLLKKKNKVTSALKIANRCLELGDERHAFYRHISETYSRADDLEKAVEFARQAVNAKNNDGSSIKMNLEYLAHTQQRSGDIDGALATINSLLKLDGKRGTAHMTRSSILLGANDRTAALDSALTAIQFGDARSWTFRHLSDLYNRLDDVPNAIEYAQRAVDAKDNNENSLKNHREHLACLQHRVIDKLDRPESASIFSRLSWSIRASMTQQRR